MIPYLILDEQSVAETHGVSFHLNPASRHPENPVLLPGEPHQWDSLCVSWPATVLYSPRDEQFRCWYTGLDVVQSPSRAWLFGYAESQDGVRWTKPTLGQAEFLGQPTNRIVPDWMTPPHPQAPPSAYGNHTLSFVFENSLPDAPPEQRFGAYWIAQLWDPIRQSNCGHKDLAWSADGIHWKFHCRAYDLQTYSRPAFQNISQLVHDADDPDPAWRVKGYTQIFRPRSWDQRPMVRHIGMVHGNDFSRVIDAPQSVVLGPEPGIDEELHFASVKKVGDTFVMLFESDRFSKNPIHGDLKLAVSADGRTFRRVHKTTPLLTTGSKGTWDENLLVTSTSAMQEVGDEIYIYYFGCPNTYNSWPPQYAVESTRSGGRFAPAYMGLARLPRDRFAYARGAGTLTTPPLVIGAGGLWLNAEGDGLRVTTLDSSGKRTVRGQLGHERRQSVYRRVVWNAAPPLGTYRLEIGLTRRDKLFSIASE